MRCLKVVSPEVEAIVGSFNQNVLIVELIVLMPGPLGIGLVFGQLKLVVLVEAEGICVGIEEFGGIDCRNAGSQLKIDPTRFVDVGGKVFERFIILPKVFRLKLSLR